MKRCRNLIIVLILTLTLSACGGVVSTPVQVEVLPGIYTAVAMTTTSEVNSFDLLPSLTPIITSTPYVTTTQILATPTYQTATPYPLSYTDSCDSSAYVSDVTIPDGTVLAPGETFVKTWEIENTGSCTWSPNYSLTFVSGDEMDGSDSTIDQVVVPGEQAEVSIPLTAPEAEDTYTGYWIMENTQGTRFGTYIYVQIVVSNSVATSTLTPAFTNTPTTTSTPTLAQAGSNTPIPTDTSTSTPTSTQTSTNTPVPTNTPTSTPTNTPTPQGGTRNWTNNAWIKIYACKQRNFFGRD